MGHINLTGSSFLGSLSETIGYKSGVALSRKDLNEIFINDKRFNAYVDLPDDNWIRLHSSAFEEVIEALLYRLGRLEKE